MHQILSAWLFDMYTLKILGSRGKKFMNRVVVECRKIGYSAIGEQAPPFQQQRWHHNKLKIHRRLPIHRLEDIKSRKAK